MKAVLDVYCVGPTRRGEAHKRYVFLLGIEELGTGPHLVLRPSKQQQGNPLSGPPHRIEGPDLKCPHPECGLAARVGKHPQKRLHWLMPRLNERGRTEVSLQELHHLLTQPKR